MSAEDKSLLLKDLSARLLYGLRCNVNFNEKDAVLSPELFKDAMMESVSLKPYLRPISSMTESEMDMLFDILRVDKDGKDEDWIKINDVLGIKFFFPTGKWVENVAEAYDYLNSIHIDYRGLIGKKLALEAPEDMYK